MRPPILGLIIGLALSVAGCNREPAIKSTTQRPDAETLRIVCKIKKREVDYFAPEPPTTPLRAAMERPRGDAYDANATGSNPQPIVGYAQDFSNAPGSQIEIRYAGELVQVGERLVQAEVFDGHTGTSLKKIDLAPGRAPLKREICKSWYGGCEFSQSISIETTGFPSGVHYVFLTDDKGAQSLPIYFHMRPTNDEVRKADVAILLSELTWTAYNYYGGGSLYGIQHLSDSGGLTIGQNSQSLLYASSMRKPLLVDPSHTRPIFTDDESVTSFFADESHRNLGQIKFEGYDRISWIRVSPESQLVPSRLLRQNGKTTVLVSLADLEASPGLLDGAKVVLLTGHNEYWTQRMLDVFQEYVENGGRVANFSGNVAWWQINFVNGAIYQDQGGHSRSPACENSLDSEFRKTGMMYLVSPNEADQLFGLNYRFANFPLAYMLTVPEDQLVDLYKVKDPAKVDQSLGRGFVVRRPDHPIFAGLDLKPRQRFGAQTPVMAVEIDGVPLAPDGKIDRSWPNGFSEETSVLGETTTFVASYVSSADGRKRYIGIKDAGVIIETAPLGNDSRARVLSFGSIGYVFTLAARDPRFEKMLMNAIEYLSQEELPPALKE